MIGEREWNNDEAAEKKKQLVAQIIDKSRHGRGSPSIFEQKLGLKKR